MVRSNAIERCRKIVRGARPSPPLPLRHGLGMGLVSTSMVAVYLVAVCLVAAGPVAWADGAGHDGAFARADAAAFVRADAAFPRSAKTLVVAVEIDRTGARIVDSTIKDRPFREPRDVASRLMLRSGQTEQIEVVLAGADGPRFTRTIDVRGLCLDHDPGTEAHIQGDTIRLHREIVLVELPDLEDADRMEVARLESRQGSTVRTLLGVPRLASSAHTVGAAGPFDARSGGPGADESPASPFNVTHGTDASVRAAQPQGEMSAAAAPVTTGAVHWPAEYGDSDIYTVYGDEADGYRRINIVIVPDGYVYAEKGLMQTHALDMVNAFRNKTPYMEHDPFINYILVYAYSTQSGTDQCDCSIVRDTAMNTRFPKIGTNPCGNSNNRCLYYGTENGGPNCDPTTSFANIVAAEMRAPIHDTTIVMVNTNRYGGCGGDRAVYSAANGSATEVAIHELGHSLAGLADEYVSFVGCGSQAGNINTSTNGVTGAWPEWIADIGPPQQGADYYSQCIYRPEGNCEMRALNQPFCRVCQQQWALTYFGHYRTVGTAPISDVFPYEDVTVQVGLPATFSVQTRFATGANVTNEIAWLISGPGFPDPTEVATQVTEHTQTLQTPGTYALTCDVTADTNFIKPEKTGGNHTYNTWTIFAVPVPEVSGPSDPQILVSRNGANVDIRFADTGSSRYNLYVSKTPSTHPFHVASPAGKKECALSGLVPAGGGMKELQNYDLDAGLSVPPGTVLYILVTADNGPGTEGTPGTDSAGADRTTDSSCAH